MPKIRVVLKSYKIEEFKEKAPLHAEHKRNRVRYEDGMCIVEHECRTKETAFPIEDVKKVETDKTSDG